MVIPLKVTKTVRKFDQFLVEYWVEELKDVYIPLIQEMIMEEYDAELIGVVTDRNSRTNPLFYRDDFETALVNFEYIIEGINTVTLRVPDEDNFPWLQGRLRVIRNIIQGTVGTYVEVDEEQYVKLYDKKPIAEEPYDNTVPRKERIYLLKYNADVQRRERDRFNRRVLVRYPFSNRPPIDIFAPANDYVTNNLNEWMQQTIKKAQKEFNP